MKKRTASRRWQPEGDVPKQATECQAVREDGPPAGEDRERQTPRASVIGARRVAGPDFTACFLELREVVAQTCRLQTKWEAKVVAGIQAALGFAAAEPAKARALTVSARRPAFGERYPEQVVISYFARELGAVAPRAKRVAISTDESVVEAIALLVRGHILQRSEDRLPQTAPDLVYLALMPYLSLAEVRHWAESAAVAGKGR